NRDFGYGAMSGMRLTAGFFGDADRRFGFQIQGFFTEHKPVREKFGDLSNTAGIPTLARPFIDVNGASSAVLLSGPNFGAAIVRVRTDTQTIGVEPVGVWNLYRAEPGTRRVWSVDFLAGYKFVQLRENLIINSFSRLDDQIALPVFAGGAFGQIGQNTSIVPAQVPLGGTIVGGPAVVQLNDQFRTTNRFNGAVIGLRTEGRYGMFTSSLTAKIAAGYLNERVEISGNTTFVDPTSRSGTPSTFGFPSGVGGNGGSVGGVLANPSNIGTFVHDRFTYIPEVGVTFGVALTRGLTAYVGGNFIYMPDVVRVGNTVNPVVSSAAIPLSPNFGATGAARGPGFRFIEDDFWIGGATFGLMLRY
ncbi:MAG: BBP7 family outer membrane beta-barrel protein, partial [Planctomycetes bacterium]|nr:BBP7 family outer membrane beta-barrel protein [Planctomycetota bacterium]